jgi:hypothetical protein
MASEEEEPMHLDPLAAVNQPKKAKRTQLTASHKSEICAIKKKYSSFSHEQVAAAFAKKHPALPKVDRSTISKILSNTAKWAGQVQDGQADQVRQRKCQFVGLELMLFLWFKQVRATTNVT